MASPKKKTLSKVIPMDYSEAEDVFAEVFEVDQKDDVISLNVATYNIGKTKAKVSHRVFMTISHFIRLSEVCSSMTKGIYEDYKLRQEAKAKK